ncbi:MAG: hypothetical protein Q9195_004590 [Heterodermia aff. obscurata]
MSDDATPDLSSLLFTRAPLALSRTQRLVSTWLPPPTAEELAERTESTEMQREEDETFRPSSELSGLGARYTAEDEKQAMTLRSDEKLKALLLGKGGKKSKRNDGAKPAKRPSSALSGKPPSADHSNEFSSEDELGRTSLGKAKVRMPDAGVRGPDTGIDGAKHDTKLALRNNPSRPDRKATAANYLDEVLAEKAQRQQKRVRKSKQLVDVRGSQ